MNSQRDRRNMNIGVRNKRAWEIAKIAPVVRLSLQK